MPVMAPVIATSGVLCRARVNPASAPVNTTSASFSPRTDDALQPGVVVLRSLLLPLHEFDREGDAQNPPEQSVEPDPEPVGADLLPGEAGPEAGMAQFVRRDALQNGPVLRGPDRPRHPDVDVVLGQFVPLVDQKGTPVFQGEG